VVDHVALDGGTARTFHKRLKGAIREGQDAFEAKMPERPWVFFVGAQYDLDQVEFS
jgi:hypothetical protein